MNLDFNKGIHTASRESKTPPGYYRDAQNMKAENNALVSEEGLLLVDTIPADLVILGSTTLGPEVIILGILDGGSIIATYNPSTEEFSSKYHHSDAEDIFALNVRTQVEARFDWRVNRIIYFNTPTKSRRVDLDSSLDLQGEQLDQATSLFLEYDLPQVNLGSIGSTGTLGSGVYQSAARLVTESGAETPFGALSPVIPIGPGTAESSREAVVGAPPQTETSKSIIFSATNIDPLFKYIQYAFVTYIGTANTPTVHVSNLIDISGNADATYEYTGEASHLEQLPIEALIVSGVQYTSGKFITQKDGTLLIGSPTEAAQPPIDWSRVASNITVKYGIKEVPYVENISYDVKDNPAGNQTTQISYIAAEMDNPNTGYGDPDLCANFKGYRRGESYAFTMTPVFTSGVVGPTVHIPGNHDVNTPAIQQPDRMMGTKISTEKYNDNRYGLEGQGIRLHTMPTAKEEKVVSGVNSANGSFSSCSLRILYPIFEDIALDPSEEQYSNQIAGIRFGRVDTRGQETQLAQGFIKPMESVVLTMDGGFYKSYKCPAFGSGNVGYHHEVRKNYNRFKSPLLVDASRRDFSNVTMLCPDLIHGAHSLDIASGIYHHSSYQTDPYHPDLDKAKRGDGFTGYDGKDWGARWGFSAVNYYNKSGRIKLGVNNVLGARSSSSLDDTIKPLHFQRRMVDGFGKFWLPGSQGGETNSTVNLGADIIEMVGSSGFAWKKPADASPIPSDDYNTTIAYHRYFNCHPQSGLREHLWWGQENVRNSLYKRTLSVHSLYRELANQYGPLEQMVSMDCHYEEWTGGSSMGPVSVFGGDTFISKYAMVTCENGPWPDEWPTEDNTGDLDDQLRWQRTPGWTQLTYFFVESINNYNFRHSIPSDSVSTPGVTSDGGTIPVFPNYPILSNPENPAGLLTFHSQDWIWEHASQYNNQYSAQNSLKPYVETPLEDIETPESLQNRIIYSRQSIQGEKVDAYQDFATNNFYDVPSERGELTDLYVDKELYASTRQVQWTLFFNTLATQASSVGEIVLGTGGAFNRPAIPSTTADGGYGGTAYWGHAIDTPLGRVFVDKEQGKIFHSSPQGLMDITRDLDERYKQKIQGLNTEEIQLGVEMGEERVLIRLGDETLSYDFRYQAWKSSHSFLPSIMMSHGPTLLSNNNDPAKGTVGVYKHGAGPVGKYYSDDILPSYVVLSANQGSNIFKEFQSMHIGNEHDDGPFTTFDAVMFWNDSQNTGEFSIIPKTSAFQEAGDQEIISSRVNGGVRISIPRDRVIDSEGDIFAEANLKPADAEWLAKMRGTYMNIKLISNNATGRIYLNDAALAIKDKRL